jgi:predicted PurR-regulated permease PerM
MYRDGLVQLLPHARRQRARHVLQILAHSLKGWLLARFAAMIFLGIATTVGLQLIGVPLAFVLGVVAGLLNFVPIIGPLVALLPALLIASAQGIQPVVAVFVLYQALQTIETYALTPALQQVAVDLPAALALVFQLVMGIVGGALGVALGFPVALVVMLLVQMLYVEDVLGESVEIHGEHRDRYDRVA